MNIDFQQKFGVGRVRTPKPFLDLFDPKGKFHLEKWSQRKSGIYEKKLEFDFTNGITNVGKNLILNVMFAGTTAISAGAWALALIDNSGFSSLAAADTMSSHAGWSEFVGYSGGVRPAWGAVTSTAQLLTNTTLATFNITANGTIYGGFVASDNTLSGTVGTLWSTGSFPAPVPVSSGTDQIRLSYNLSC
jgi:hypothetical protein